MQNIEIILIYYYILHIYLYKNIYQQLFNLINFEYIKPGFSKKLFL